MKLDAVEQAIKEGDDNKRIIEGLEIRTENMAMRGSMAAKIQDKSDKVKKWADMLHAKAGEMLSAGEWMEIATDIPEIDLVLAEALSRDLNDIQRDGSDGNMPVDLVVKIFGFDMIYFKGSSDIAGNELDVNNYANEDGSISSHDKLKEIHGEGFIRMEGDCIVRDALLRKPKPTRGDVEQGSISGNKANNSKFKLSIKKVTDKNGAQAFLPCDTDGNLIDGGILQHVKIKKEHGFATATVTYMVKDNLDIPNGEYEFGAGTGFKYP